MSSGRFVRQSKFRHVFGEPNKESYQNVKAYTNGEGEFACGNKTYVAYPYNGGGGPVQLLHREQFGRPETAMLTKQRLNFHKDKILCQAFSPFADNVIATGAGDLAVYVHQFADFDKAGPSESLAADSPSVTLKKHSKKVVDLKWHPSSSDVLATGSHDKTVKVWNVSKQAVMYDVKLSDKVQKMAWNKDGSQLACSTGGKTVGLIDPRTGDTFAEFAGHGGSKPQTPLWSSTHGKLLVTGCTRSQVRVVAVWDPKMLGDKPLAEVELGQASGQLLPMLDDDLSILYVAGKGDSSISYFELTNDDTMLHSLSGFKGQNSQKGCGWLPKAACDTTVCEVAIALRVGTDSIEKISFRVPRKNADTFQEDIFPDCYAGIPSQSADDYQGGKNADPKTQSMDPENAPTESRKAAAMVVQKSPDQLMARVKQLEEFIAANGLTAPAE